MQPLIPYLPGLIAAWTIHVIGVASPGPSVALILGHAAESGRRAAVIAAFGVACGSVCLAILTVAGVSAILAEWREAMQAIRLFGAAYLGWLAFRALRTAAGGPIAAPRAARVAGRRSFASGFLLQVSNPKALLFWLAIAAVGATSGGPLWLSVFFVSVAFLISFAMHGAWALVLSMRPLRDAYAGARRWIEGALGLFFGAAAIKLATMRE